MLEGYNLSDPKAQLFMTCPTKEFAVNVFRKMLEESKISVINCRISRTYINDRRGYSQTRSKTGSNPDEISLDDIRQGIGMK